MISYMKQFYVPLLSELYLCRSTLSKAGLWTVCGLMSDSFVLEAVQLLGQKYYDESL